jgi:quercetin 2,3-dioxygenase
MMKKILGRFGNPNMHWVGDGFPVRSLFSYNNFGRAISPFLLLDYGGPRDFEPTTQRRGVGQHPHRGFETVTIVYSGEVEHRDSTGNGGVIGPGDVQWMTAAGGIIHEEFHSSSFASEGGPFHMVQLWVNLPARDKMAAPGYQSILNADIPAVDLPDGAGSLRVIAGAYEGTKGPAKTFTPVNVWDVQLKRDASVHLDLPDGHNSIVVVLSGQVTVGGAETTGEAEIVLLGSEGAGTIIEAKEDSKLLVLTGEPIEEPIVGYGPFVMNSETEIQQAIADFNSGQFGKIAATA